MAQRLRIFISSPADVPNERLRADLIIDKLSQDYSRFFTIESYRWEHEAMLASKHFQDAIEPPSAFDIVVLILWSGWEHRCRRRLRSASTTASMIAPR